tara:strand:- start:7613 stop:7912 length:300 start_codon:yes stop_codon:yes gene_type:complete
MLKQALDNSRNKRQQEENKNLEERIQNIEIKLNSIIEKLDYVKQDTDKMSSHITFINKIYSQVQTPLFWVCDRINLIKGNNSKYINDLTEKSEDIMSQD